MTTCHQLRLCSWKLKPLPTSPSLHSKFLHLKPLWFLNPKPKIKSPSSSLSITASSSSNRSIIRAPSLDKHVTKHNKLRFVRKLKTLLLSKPKNYIPLKILSRCRAYLSLPKPRSLVSMIRRYPTIFQLFTLPSYSSLEHLLCVRLTPAAAALAFQELELKSRISNTLAAKLQKLLMLSTHKRIVLSKLVHLAPDLGFPPNFRSRLCNDHPDRFKTVDTSFGRALELVSWDPQLAVPLPVISKTSDFIVDRPLKFKQLTLRKGVNVKRKHREFLIKFSELPEVCPYNTSPLEDYPPESIEAEKRACGVVREVLGMTLEKRTLVDHLTHFRKDFGLSNKLRGMLVRHPELFYVSLKGLRDSVFLVEGYDDKGKLLGKDDDELLIAKQKLIELVRLGKKIRRERKLKDALGGLSDDDDDEDEEVDDYKEEEDDVEDDDSFSDLFEDEEDWEDYSVGDEDMLVLGDDTTPADFWTIDGKDGVRGEPPLKHW